jgi:hypothetical protein
VQLRQQTYLVEKHDSLDPLRKEFITNAETCLKYLDMDKVDRTVEEKIGAPVFGKNYTVPQGERMPSSILKAFISRIDYKLSNNMLRDYASLIRKLKLFP